MSICICSILPISPTQHAQVLNSTLWWPTCILNIYDGIHIFVYDQRYMHIENETGIWVVKIPICLCGQSVSKSVTVSQSIQCTYIYIYIWCRLFTYFANEHLAAHSTSNRKTLLIKHKSSIIYIYIYIGRSGNVFGCERVLGGLKPKFNAAKR